MAYFTQITGGIRTFTEAEQATLDSYLAEQTAAGTTDNNKYRWVISADDTLPLQTRTNRMWSTIESANSYKNLLASFNPAVLVAVY